MTGKRVLGNTIPVLRYFCSFIWRNQPTYFALVAGDMLLRGVSPFVNIVFPKLIIDELMGQQRHLVIVAIIGFAMGANLLIRLLGNVRDFLLARTNDWLDFRLNEEVARKVMEMDFEYIEQPRVLNHLERAWEGINYSGGIAGLVGEGTQIVSNLISMLGTLYIIALLSPWLLLIMLVTIALNLRVTAQSQQKEMQFKKDLVGINRCFGYYIRMLKDFSFGKDIRLYDASDMVMKRVHKYVVEERNQFTRLGAIRSRYSVLLGLFSTAQEGLLYGYLGLQALAGAITVGDLQMLVSAARTFAQGLTGALSRVITLKTDADFLVEYKTFMEYPPVKMSGTATPPRQAQHGLRVQCVSFRYPGSQEFVLKDISLDIPAGQRLALVGPNGAGKTTFVKLLTRLYDPAEGQILLDGIDIREFDLDEYAKLFAVVFQDYRLLAFSVRDNLICGSEGDEDALRRSLELAGLADRLARLPRGLDTPIYKAYDEEGVEFSGGESQKLAIARAIYKNAPIVILDEPTAALDPVAEYEVYRRFDELTKGRTAIYISHRLSSCRFCDRIAVFDHGQIVEYGTHDELCARGGLYARMWNAQAQWYTSQADSQTRETPMSS